MFFLARAGRPRPCKIHYGGSYWVWVVGRDVAMSMGSICVLLGRNCPVDLVFGGFIMYYFLGVFIGYHILGWYYQVCFLAGAGRPRPLRSFGGGCLVGVKIIRVIYLF